jgi:hypothetical protein
MAVTLTNYTLTYDPDERVKGWPSFYSYYPDWMIGMNNFFYTLYRGNLYRHNSNQIRNRFYDVNYNSTITTVFNAAPLENKLFKTLELQGTSAWTAYLETDIQVSTNIDSSWFEKKEQVWFAFVRNRNVNQPSGSIPTNFLLRSVNGLAQSLSVDTTDPAAVIINFALSVDLSRVQGSPIGSGNDVADTLFFGTGTPTLCGQVVEVDINLQAGINRLIVNTTAPIVTGGNTPPTGTEFFLYAKNSTAESHGVLGHYSTVKLTNSLTTQVELFAVQSEVMKSYP